MKIRFVLLTMLLLFARGCDFYSTRLWYVDSPQDETNPLASLLGFGWSGLLIVNISIVGLIIYAYYYYSFKYTRKRLPGKPERMTEFISELYFNEKGKFYRVFYQMPKDKRVLLGHSGYILLRVLIIASLLATLHNLGQFYQVPAYQAFRAWVSRPSWVIYGLIACSFVYFSYRLWKKEFDAAKREWELHL